MKTKPRGMWANFTYNCVTCGGDCYVNNGKPEPHTCRISLDHIDWPPPAAS